MSKLQYYTDLELKIKEVESQLERYKSIVKKVDPCNLPDIDVWAWCDEGLYLGRIDFDYNKDLFIIRSHQCTYDEPTHYIEQKDLIKLFEV